MTTKKILACFAISLVGVSLSVLTGPMEPAHATTIGFEGGLDPMFTYSGNVVSSQVPIGTVSGYDNVAAFTGSTGAIFNFRGTHLSSFFIAGGPTATFTLNSFVIAGAWGTQTLTIEGWNNGGVLFSSAYSVSLTPSIFTAGWAGINELRISTGNDYVHDDSTIGNGQQWVLDNLRINEPTSNVPEPFSFLLLGSGLVGLAAWRPKHVA